MTVARRPLGAAVEAGPTRTSLATRAVTWVGAGAFQIRVPLVSELRAFMVAGVSTMVELASWTVGVTGLVVVAAGPDPALEVATTETV